jgi:hypothetical protein
MRTGLAAPCADDGLEQQRRFPVIPHERQLFVRPLALGLAGAGQELVSGFPLHRSLIGMIRGGRRPGAGTDQHEETDELAD